jgi:hypothetical protein
LFVKLLDDAAYWRRAIRAAPLAEEILNNTPTLLDHGELGDGRWWLTCEWHDLGQFNPRPGRIEAAGPHRPPASHHPSNGVELVHPDGALTTVLTAADGLQNHTAIARHANTVYVADAAYVTATDPNLSTAPYPTLTTRRSVRSNTYTFITGSRQLRCNAGWWTPARWSATTCRSSFTTLVKFLCHTRVELPQTTSGRHILHAAFRRLTTNTSTASTNTPAVPRTIGSIAAPLSAPVVA